MAEKVIRLLVDDAESDEVEADAGTITFGYQGRSYEIDLSKKNATKMDTDFQRWIDHARPTGSQRARRSPTPTVKTSPGSGYNPDQLRAIRDWARRNGWPNISDKGRVPGEVLVGFEQRAGAEEKLFSAAT